MRAFAVIAITVCFGYVAGYYYDAVINAFLRMLPRVKNDQPIRDALEQLEADRDR